MKEIGFEIGFEIPEFPKTRRARTTFWQHEPYHMKGERKTGFGRVFSDFEATFLCGNAAMAEITIGGWTKVIIQGVVLSSSSSSSSSWTG